MKQTKLREPFTRRYDLASLTYHAEGVLYGQVEPRSVATAPRRHSLRLKPIRSRDDVSESLPVGAQATRWIIESERRAEERALWQHFLAYDLETHQRHISRLTHTLTWGYWLSDGTYIQVLRGSFNFFIPQRDTKSIAIRCCDFLYDQAVRQPVVLDGFEQLVQHQSLTSTKVVNRINWLTLLFTQFLWLHRKGD